MRIAIVTTYPPSKGSLNEYAYHFVRFLRQKPEVSEIILLVDELPCSKTTCPDVPTLQLEAADHDEPGAPFCVVPCWNFDACDNPMRILNMVRRVKPDIVLFNVQFATFGGRRLPGALGLLTPALLKLFGYPTVVLLHNIMETVDLRGAGYASQRWIEGATRFFGSVITRLLLTSDYVAVTIPKYVDILEKKYGATNVLLAPHGSFEEPAGLPAEESGGPFRIMTFGKFGTYKKVEPMIQALELLRVGERQQMEVVIAGTDSPNAAGYLEGVHQQYAHVPGVRFTGYVAEEDVSRVFGEASVVVFPYTSTTGSSGVLHQAGEYGKAVVLPHIGDFAEIIAEEGYTGEFFEPNDPQSLAEAIGRLLESPERRHEIGQQNYLAARGLPISDVVDWYLLHFQSVLKQRAAR
ncbi:MAG: glycosyltransferase family 4 protein [Herpetosiphon sp.]